MTVKETKQSKDNHIPASLRILNLGFDSCFKHVDYNIEKLSEMLTNEGNVHNFDVLNYVIPIITNVCKIVEPPTSGHKNDTFCISTYLESCHQEDIKEFKDDLKNIRGNDIYGILKDARNQTVAHISSAYKGYGDAEKALEEIANYLIEREDRLKSLIKSINSLIHHVVISIRKKEGKPLNADTITIEITPSK